MQSSSSRPRACAMNLLCKIFLWSCLCCLLAAMPVQAQEDGQGHAARHHPPQDQFLHERFYSTRHMPDNPLAGCCNDADCYPTEIKCIDGSICAKRRDGNTP